MQFAIADVVAETRPYATLSQKAFLERMVDGPVEACSHRRGQVLNVPHGNQLIAAVHLAHAKHYPLVLSPDMIWLTITQGFAKHVKANSERLRKHFVAHEGKITLEVRDDSLVRGSPDNDWTRSFGEFSSQIRGHIGEATHSMLVSDFSTTGPVEKAASEIVLMDAMQCYFNYFERTMCGIPSVRLLGSVEDWERLYAKAQALDGRSSRVIEVTSDRDLGLGFWLPSLLEVLTGFVNVAKGMVDRSWWSSIYNLNSGSGGPYIGGWISWLFPYLEDGQQNRMIGQFGGGMSGLHVGDFPNSLSKAPFVWKVYEKLFDYQFLAGLTGVSLDNETREIGPVIGWAVRPEHSGPSKRAGYTADGRVKFNG